MARHGSILGLSRSLGDVDHVRDAVLAVPGFAAGLAYRPAGSQTPGQVKAGRYTIYVGNSADNTPHTATLTAG
jgi:hypothetical protein